MFLEMSLEKQNKAVPCFFYLSLFEMNSKWNLVSRNVRAIWFFSCNCNLVVSKRTTLPGLRIDSEAHRTVLENHDNSSQQKDSDLEILMALDGIGNSAKGCV